MRTELFAVAVALAACSSAPAPLPAAPPAPAVCLAGVTPVRMLTSAELLPPELDPIGFEMTNQGVIVLAQRNVYQANSHATLFADSPGKLSGLALGAAGMVVAVGDWLGEPKDGKFEPRAGLPAAGVRLSADGETVYLYGGDGVSAGSVYALLPGGHYQKLFATEAPVRALAAQGGRVFFAVGSRIYTWQDGEEPASIGELSAAAPIEALAYDPTERMIYASAERAVWAIAGAEAVLVAGDIAGELRVAQGELFVLDPKRRELYLLAGAAAAVEALRSTPAAEAKR